LGSTNAVTDQNGNLVQLLDYYPYGATRIATSTLYVAIRPVAD